MTPDDLRSKGVRKLFVSCWPKGRSEFLDQERWGQIPENATSSRTTDMERKARDAGLETPFWCEKAAKMMERSGWTHGQSLGIDSASSNVEPLQPDLSRVRGEKRGVGFTKESSSSTKSLADFRKETSSSTERLDEVDSPGEELQWFYLDRRGQEFGLFAAQKMRQWYLHGFFSVGEELLVRLQGWSSHVPVRVLYSQASDAFNASTQFLPRRDYAFCPSTRWVRRDL